MIINTISITMRDFGWKGLKLLGEYYLHSIHSNCFGPRVTCPICKWSGKQFYPFLLQPLWVRAAALCPGCGALERHRALYHYYSENFSTNGMQGKKILHFSPESCLKTLFSQMSIQYVCSEYKNPGDGDMQDMKYPDKHFDVIISHHVLEHVENDDRALSEIKRVLTDDGVCYLSVPVSWERKTCEYGYANPKQNYHYRSYGADIIKKFEGFKWRRFDFKVILDDKTIKRHGINPEEPLFELKKKQCPRSSPELSSRIS
jgi:SAM-dependent methyltransferase